MAFWILICAATSFAAGWAFGVWLCSKKRWCPLHMEESVHVWKRKVEEANRARRESHPELVEDAPTAPLPVKKKGSP